MLKDFRLNQLSVAELLNLQKHIEFGHEHLESLISQKGIEKLCSLDLLNSQVENKVKAAPADLTGTFTKFINGALTAALGAWVGVNGIADSVLTSKCLFQAVMLSSLGIGAAIGIQNYRFTKKDIQKQLEVRKLQDIQLSILDYLREGRLQEIKKKTEEINVFLQKMKVGQEARLDQNGVLDPSFYLKEFEQMERLIQQQWEKQNPQIIPFFTDEFRAIKEKIGQNLMAQPPASDNVPPVLKPLIKAPLPKTPAKKSWIRNNWKYLLISSIPVLYGTFSSLFGASTNAKIIAQQVEWPEMYFFLTHPHIRKLGYFLAFAITLYFTFSFIIKNRRKFQRDQEIDKAVDQIIKRQAILFKLDDQILKLKEVLISAQRTSGIYEVLNKVKNSLH